MLVVALFSLLALGICSDNMESPSAGAAKAGSLGLAAAAAEAVSVPVGSEGAQAERSGQKDLELPSSRSLESEEETNRKIRKAFRTGDAPAGGALPPVSATSSDKPPSQPAAELHGNTRHVMDVADKTPPPAATGSKETSDKSLAAGGATGDKTATATNRAAPVVAAPAGLQNSGQQNTG
jgi:hypothetical protein